MVLFRITYVQVEENNTSKSYVVIYGSNTYHKIQEHKYDQVS